MPVQCAAIEGICPQFILEFLVEFKPFNHLSPQKGVENLWETVAPVKPLL
jgi:hypothetical protein